MRNLYESLCIAVAALLLVYLGVVIDQNCLKRGSVIEPNIKVDTLVIHDTTRLTEPIFVMQKTIDTMLVAVTDTIVRNDTTFVTLPRQQREYMSPKYHAWVSGYDPKLDSLWIYKTNSVVTKEIPVIQKQRPRWSVGVGVGYGMNRDGLSPYVGVGINYNLFSW